jgi:hypothetical protein
VTVDRLGERPFATWLSGITYHHAGIGAKSRKAPPRWMMGLTGWLQAAITTARFEATIAEEADLRRYLLAWNKLRWSGGRSAASRHATVPEQHVEPTQRTAIRRRRHRNRHRRLGRR